MEEKTTKTKSHPAHKIVFFTLFLDLLGFGLIIPVQPFWAQEFGAEPWLVTLLGASYSAMQVLFIPFWGKLSDKYGRRPIILTSISITIFAYTIFASAQSLLWLFIGRALSGFGNANLATAQAIISDTTTPENRARGMGMVGAAFGLGFVFGPAIGGALAQIGPRCPGYAAALLAVVNLIWAYRSLPETRPVGQGESTAKHNALKVFTMLSHKDGAGNQKPKVLVTLAILSMIYTLAFSCMEQVVGLLIERFYVMPASFETAIHLSKASAATAIFLLVVGVTLAVVQGMMIGKLVKKHGEEKLLKFGLLIVAGSLIALPYGAATLPYGVFLILGIAVAAGSALVGPSVTSLISKKSPLDKQGEYLGINQSASALGRVGGPAIAGMLFQIYPATPFVFGGIVILALWFYLTRCVLDDPQTS